MPHMIPAFEFRRRARAAMKPVMSILILVMLIAMLPSLISTTITMITGSDPAEALMNLYTEERITAMLDPDMAVANAAMEEFLGGMKAFFLEKWPFMALTAAVTMLLGPVLKLGFNHTLLKVLRKEEISVSTVMARMPLFFKAIGLNLMIVLRTLLWSLPGMALSLLGAVAVVFVPAVGVLVMVAAMVLMTVQLIQATYRYRLATYIVADAPETGINAAIRRSNEVMRGRKMELFSLEISFIGWRLVLSMGQTMLLGMLGSVVGMTLGMFASFFLQMYIYMAEAAFYQEYAVGPLQAEAAAVENDELT